MVGLYQDPEGKTVFLRTNQSCSTTDSLISDIDTIESLRKQVQELKNEVRVIVHVGEALVTHDMQYVSAVVYVVYGAFFIAQLLLISPT